MIALPVLPPAVAAAGEIAGGPPRTESGREDFHQALVDASAAPTSQTKATPGGERTESSKIEDSDTAPASQNAGQEPLLPGPDAIALADALVSPPVAPTETVEAVPEAAPVQAGATVTVVSAETEGPAPLAALQLELPPPAPLPDGSLPSSAPESAKTPAEPGPTGTNAGKMPLEQAVPPDPTSAAVTLLAGKNASTEADPLAPSEAPAARSSAPSASLTAERSSAFERALSDRTVAILEERLQQAAAPIRETTEAAFAGPAGAGVLPTAAEPPAAAQPAPQVLPLPLTAAEVERLAIELARAARQYGRSGIAELTFRLHPPQLGELRVHLTVQGDTTRVQLLVETREALDLVRSQLPELTAGLREHGLRLGETEVGWGQGTSAGGDPDADGPGPRSPMPYLEDADDRGPPWDTRAGSESERWSQGSGRLDCWA